MLTHYTNTLKAVENILVNGFAWKANRRNLTHLLMPGHDFSKREPQQFGMISFTEIEPSNAEVHCKKFGFFGIVISKRWAREKNARRVIYVDENGPVTEAWRNLFAIGYSDVRSRVEYPDDGGWLMAYENKVAASAIAGSVLWASLLQLWEYMEPASDAQQREWRIVNPVPLYSLSESKSEVIRQVSPPKNWATITNVVPIPRCEVEALICPSSVIPELTSALPENYKNITILKSDSWPKGHWFRKLRWSISK
jgi:hypothetical protein